MFLIGLIILGIAWINYINLSTARSVERAKEVGVRKVLGAAKQNLVAQFMLENIIIEFCRHRYCGDSCVCIDPCIQSIDGAAGY